MKYIDFYCLKHKYLSFNSIRIWSRNSVIPLNFIGKKVYVYNGRFFKPIEIARNIVGYKFGVFSFTRQKKRISKKQMKVNRKSFSRKLKKK